MVRNIAKSYIVKNSKNDLSPGKILLLFLDKFSNYNFDYLIDENGLDKPYIQNIPEDNKRFFIYILEYQELNKYK